jgi:hypothetical protein
LLIRVIHFLLYFVVALSIAAFLGALVVLLAVGHVLRSSRWTYPFETWAMYGNARPPRPTMSF